MVNAFQNIVLFDMWPLRTIMFMNNRENIEENEAATAIQAAFRGYKTRRDIKNKKTASSLGNYTHMAWSLFWLLTFPLSVAIYGVSSLLYIITGPLSVLVPSARPAARLVRLGLELPTWTTRNIRMSRALPVRRERL